MKNGKLPDPNVIHPIGGYDKEASGRWGITEHWVQKFGHSWMIPKDAVGPDNLRKNKAKENSDG